MKNTNLSFLFYNSTIGLLDLVGLLSEIVMMNKQNLEMFWQMFIKRLHLNLLLLRKKLQNSMNKYVIILY